MTAKRTLLVTGASGYIAERLLPELRRRYVLRLVDARDRDRRGRRVAGVTVADLSDPGRWAADATALDLFDVELENVRMAQNVYRTALENGVRRVVMASSNHAADWYEHALIHESKRELVSPADLPLSDNFYGWSKAAYELLGFVYASGSLGRKLEVVLLRIGAPRDVSARHYVRGRLAEQHVGPRGSALANFKRDLLTGHIHLALGQPLFVKGALVIGICGLVA